MVNSNLLNVPSEEGMVTANRIVLRAPVIMLVLSAIAIPVEWRPWGSVPLDLSFEVPHFLVNIAGFLPVGFVLGGLGLLRASIIAALLSTFAEIGQFAMMYRDPSVSDVVANAIGGILGSAVSVHWRIRSPEVRITRWRATAAAGLAVALILGAWTTSGGAVNARGVTAPGTLEAHWKFDDVHGGEALDSSGHGLRGRFNNESKSVSGVLAGAVKLDSAKDYIKFSHSGALRLAGSMTISAWINSTSFPADDAAIVSQFRSDFGYQLDTTVDKGPRTIGFKLTNACGKLMARYGATPLTTGSWYHVAGVYDAEARTLDVYLNGELDNGILLGPVTRSQHSSRAAVYVGRRADLEGFSFAGSIDDVRIYSAALTKGEIVADMHGSVDRADFTRSRNPVISTTPDSCAVMSDAEDQNIPLAAAALGVLVAVACVGFWPSAGPLLYLVTSLAAGLLLLTVGPSTLPLFNLGMMSLVSLAGGASVAFSVRGRFPQRLRNE
ncbi:MAG: LamG-like jellyroll fold domain-containing protein [Bryobacteraceae bacterium]